VLALAIGAKIKVTAEGELQYGAERVWTFGVALSSVSAALSTHLYPLGGLDIGLKAGTNSFLSGRLGWRFNRFGRFDLGFDVGVYQGKGKSGFGSGEVIKRSWEAGISLSYLLYEDSSKTSDKLGTMAETTGIAALLGGAIALLALSSGSS